VGNFGVTLAAMVLLGAASAHAGVTVLLEEPFGHFGGMNPTGHAAVYLSRVCAASPTSLRRCDADEDGVVISRYHRVGGVDWIAVPLLPYLYAVDRPDEVPASADANQVAKLRDAYRRAHLESVAPNAEDGGMPEGDWTQLVGEAYDRTIYAFEAPTTEQQEDALIARFNARPNDNHFNLLFHNCADFVRQTVDFLYPHAIHRSFLADVGIMTPKQAAKSFVGYSKRKDLPLDAFVIPQVAGTIPRSRPVRGVLESLVKSKRYAVPLVSLAVLHPALGGSMAFAWLDGSRFDPRKIAEREAGASQPAGIAEELKTDGADMGAAQ
jgi:hypothetical protein